MHKFQLNRAVKIAGEMIKAFYIKGDVEKVLSYINSNNFTWIGGSVDQILTNIEDVRKFFYRFVDVIRESLDFLSEDYQVVASSEDSCVIVSKIILRDKQHSNQVKLFFSFYFQIVDKKILCSSYHVHHLDLNCGCPLYQFVYNDEIKIDSPRLDMTKIATKGFLLEDCLPYIYINLQFIELIGYKRLRNFIAMSQKSSLSQIHPADQSRYVEVLNRCRSKLKSKDQNSYFVSYRTQSPEQTDQDSSQVFEWGMISKVDDRFVVNALVFPIEEVEEIKNSDSSFFFDLILGGGGQFSQLVNDCGIHVGDSLVIFSRQRQVELDGRKINLTPSEFEILLVLVENLNKPIEPSEFYKSIWRDGELQITSNTLTMHICNLRRKLELSKDSSIRIEFIRGKGYRLSLNE